MLKLLNRKTFSLVLIGSALLFAGLRLVHLDSDFPPGITCSKVLYTDEGWYANAALNRIVTGKWHIEGDFNPAVSMPVAHLLQFITFSLCGMSLASARLTVIVFFILMLAGAFLLARKTNGSLAASYTVFLLSVNILMFSYSRLAILEIPMMTFVVFSLLAAVSLGQRSGALAAAVSSGLLAVACLTKTTAVFAFPIIVALSWRTTLHPLYRWRNAGIAIAVFTVLFGGYYAVAAHLYPDDLGMFIQANFGNRVSFDPLQFRLTLIDRIREANNLEPLAHALSLLFGIVFIILSTGFRKNVLVWVSFSWIILYTAVLGISFYHPSRYFLPLMLPLAFLFGLVMTTLRDFIRRPIYRLTSIIIVMYIFIFHTYYIVSTINGSRSTFVTMAREVKQIVERERKGGLILGDFANSVCLETKLRSINTIGTRPLRWRLDTYKPDFYLSLGAEPQIIDTLHRKYRIELLGKWNVYNNFLGDRVYLMRLWPRNSDIAQTRPD